MNAIKCRMANNPFTLIYGPKSSNTGRVKISVSLYSARNRLWLVAIPCHATKATTGDHALGSLLTVKRQCISVLVCSRVCCCLSCLLFWSPGGNGESSLELTLRLSSLLLGALHHECLSLLLGLHLCPLMRSAEVKRRSPLETRVEHKHAGLHTKLLPEHIKLYTQSTAPKLHEQHSNQYS